MNIMSVCGAAVAASLLAVILKKQGMEYSFILTICAVTMLFVYILSSIVVSVDYIKGIFDRTEINKSYLTILLKCIGICFITEFTCDCCKDASQQALSGTVLLCGRISVLITALPLFTEFLSIALRLSGGSV
ncbi:MAG: hypothetical protein E7566_00890 [Ruminococcaceae bacterium]|nr:hypothetical protein [Oscillospiraceae bacterium]